MEFNNLEAYNKAGKHETHGTLIGNWHEEAQLKEETGQSRLHFPKHIPKSHKQLFDENKITPPSSTHTTKSTAQRIFGQDTSVRFAPANAEYGRSSNPAEKLPKIGKKTDLLTKQILAVVMSELEKEEVEDIKKQSGDFLTTNQIQFQRKPIIAKNIGSLVMRNQNGEVIDKNSRDFDFLAQTALASDAELKAAISNTHYSTQKPITFYTEKVNDGCFYGSEGSSANMFGRKIGKPLYL